MAGWSNGRTWGAAATALNHWPPRPWGALAAVAANGRQPPLPPPSSKRVTSINSCCSLYCRHHPIKTNSKHAPEQLVHDLVEPLIKKHHVQGVCGCVEGGATSACPCACACGVGKGDCYLALPMRRTLPRCVWPVSSDRVSLYLCVTWSSLGEEAQLLSLHPCSLHEWPQPRAGASDHTRC